MTVSTDHERGPTTATQAPQRLFSRVIVGIDPSIESREAARQAARLMDGRGRLELLAAYEVYYPGAVIGRASGAYADEDRKLYEDDVAGALERARAAVSRDSVRKIVEQRPADALLAEAARTQATLLAVGSHGHGRTAGIVLGSVATEVVHRARCSVLVARKSMRPKLRTIVVGLDGSAESASAYAVAAELAQRFGAELWPLVAHGGRPVDRRSIDTLTVRREESPDAPVKGLVAASADAGLLVVGSRGVHGLKALGSVSERVAHDATCSTLIVRERDWPGADA